MEILRRTVYNILADLGHREDILGELQRAGDHKYDDTLKEIQRAKSRLEFYKKLLGYDSEKYKVLAEDGQMDINTALWLVLGTYDLDERLLVEKPETAGEVAKYLEEVKAESGISLVSAHRKRLFDPTRPEEWEEAGVERGSRIHIFANYMGTGDPQDLAPRIHEIAGMLGEFRPRKESLAEDYFEFELDTRGVHARPFTKMVERVTPWPYEVSVVLQNQQECIDGKSIFALMMSGPQMMKEGKVRLRFYRRPKGSDDPPEDIGYRGVKHIFVDPLNEMMEKEAAEMAEQRRMAMEERERRSSE